MKTLYKTKAVSHGGRNGEVRVEGSPLRFELAAPAALGGAGKEGANPEQLFAAGYAACFESALLHAARAAKITPASASVEAEVGIGPNGKGGYQLSVAITATVGGVKQAVAERLAVEAHQICPYSNATRGNIEVTVAARAE